MKKLNEKELNETNGGGLLGNSDDSSNQGGLTGSLGIGNLLSTSSESHDGDESSKSSASVGNNIGGSTTGVFDSMKS